MALCGTNPVFVFIISLLLINASGYERHS